VSIDPLQGYDKTPSVSFKNKDKGYLVRLFVMEGAKLVQSRDFQTGQPAVWKNKDGSTSPKMAVVIKVEHEGQTKSLWATQPSSLFAALRHAQQQAGSRIAPGGVLKVWIDDVVETKGKDKKEYGAEYIPADVLASASEEVPY